MLVNRLAPARASVRVQHARRSLSVRASANPLSAGAQRGVIILPGLGNCTEDYDQLKAEFQRRGLDVEVAKVSRLDWGRNAAALTDADWWKGCLKPRPAVDWYLNKVDDAMKALKARAGDAVPITMLTHSAGGWLGRVYMLDWGVGSIDRFVSLGSPHQPPPDGVIDQTRGILTYVSQACPGAHHDEVTYVTISSKFVKGVSMDSTDGGILAKFAGAGYQQVCGDAGVWGDFIVPLPSAHLEGALNVDLEGAFHSPLGEKLPFLGPWYGSEQYLEQWFHHVTGEEPSGAAVGAKAAVAQK